jgi:hypothetical protein
MTLTDKPIFPAPHIVNSLILALASLPARVVLARTQLSRFFSCFGRPARCQSPSGTLAIQLAVGMPFALYEQRLGKRL